MKVESVMDRLGRSTFCGVAELCHCNATKQYSKWQQNEFYTKILANLKIKKRPFNTEYLCPHPTLTVITKSVPFCVYDRVKANFLWLKCFFGLFYALLNRVTKLAN